MSHPLSRFEKIFVINLPSRSDRRREMAEQLEAIGIDPRSSQVEWFPAFRPETAGGFQTVGAHGCYLSHLGVLEIASRENYTNVLVLEDDLNFDSEFLKRAPSIVAQVVDQPYGFFYAGHHLRNTPSTTVFEVAPDEPVEAAHFLGISGAVVTELAGYLQAMLLRPPGHADGGPMHVDGAYSWFRHSHPHYPTYAVSPPLGYQRSSRTDIHQLRWFDRMPGMRNVVQALRQLRN